MNGNAEIIKLVKDSETLIQWMDSRLDGLSIPSDDRCRLSAGCFHVALEHQKSIVLLVANLLHGSAFALVRLIFEAYVRGLWLYRCASKDEVDKFQNEKGGIDKTFATLITEIEQVKGYEYGMLSDVKKTSWKAMNDYTHSGIRQISRRITEDSIEPTYAVSEIRDCITSTAAFGLMAALEISLMAKADTLALELLEKTKTI